MESVGTGTRSRLRRHSREIVLLAIVVFALAALGVTPDDQPVWVAPVGILVGAVAISWSFAHWAPGSSRDRLVPRAYVHTGALTVITYATGWGFALPMVHLFAVADNVRHGTSRDVGTVLRAAVAWTLAAQLLLTAGAVPNIHAPSIADTWGIAGLMLVCVAAVSVRIRGMASRLETAQDDLGRSERRFRRLVEDSSDMVLLIRDGRIVYESPSTERILGHPPDVVANAGYIEFVHPDDRGRVVDEVVSLLAAPDTVSRIECRLRHADGQWVPVEATARNFTADDDLDGLVVNVRDVTERKALEEQLEHRAFHDPLTGLPNRALFRDRVEHLVQRGARASLEAAVLYVDVDGFKDINDSLGHDVGDRVLREIARRIHGSVRVADTAARLGGDEFAVLLEDLDGPHAAVATAERIVRVLGERLRVDDHALEVSASVGVALLTGDDATDDLVRNADIAMYEAKGQGRGGVAVYRPEMHEDLVERLALSQAIVDGLERGEFVVHYQPIVAIEDASIRGVEALVRWQHPDRGMVSPADFIPIAEDSGTIVELGRFVLREAVGQLRDWHVAGHDHLTVSVNVSMRQLHLGDLVADVREVLDETGVDPSAVILELTETAFIANTDLATTVIAALCDLGVRLAIDDFGTGYSSLSHLQRFPLHELKIDRAFIAGMADGTQSPMLVRAIVAMSEGLRLRTVAEGIETERERALVAGLGCELGQGWLFARPAPAPAITELLAGAIGAPTVATVR